MNQLYEMLQSHELPLVSLYRHSDGVSVEFQRERNPGLDSKLPSSGEFDKGTEAVVGIRIQVAVDWTSMHLVEISYLVEISFATAYQAY